jgi:DNA-binding NarL/FixJ family response regulator
MAKKLAPVGQGAGTFQGVAVQSAATLTPPNSTRRQPALTAEQRAEIVRAYVNGWTVRAIAKHVGRSYGTVHRVLTEENVTMRGRSGR